MNAKRSHRTFICETGDRLKVFHSTAETTSPVEIRMALHSGALSHEEYAGNMRLSRNFVRCNSKMALWKNCGLHVKRRA